MHYLLLCIFHNVPNDLKGQHLLVGVINNFGGFYRTWVYVNEAKKLGATIHLPCVNRSEYFTCLSGKDIYLGFVHIQSLETALAKRIAEERMQNGDYLDMENFIRRTGVTPEQLQLLVTIDAFRFTGKTKKQILWEALSLVKSKPATVEVNELFEVPAENFSLDHLEYSAHENAYDEINLLGFPGYLFILRPSENKGQMRAKGKGLD